MKGNRKTYGHVDIGRVELEGGWYSGESWSLEVHCGYWPLVKRLCIVYLQVGKLCLSVSIRLGDKEEERVGVPVAEATKPSAEEIRACHAIITAGVCTNAHCVFCGNDSQKTDGIKTFRCPGPEWSNAHHSCPMTADGARAWLAERGIPLEEATE